MHELRFTHSRSSGAGGQHVNKVNSKVSIRWSISKSLAISDEQRILLLQKLNNQLTKDGDLIIVCQENRSQLQNKDSAIQKLNSILASVFKKRKARKPGKPSKASIKKRLENKKRHSDKKQQRRRID